MESVPRHLESNTASYGHDEEPAYSIFLLTRGADGEHKARTTARPLTLLVPTGLGWNGKYPR